jgi:adenosylcobinamide amidohydrolase
MTKLNLASAALIAAAMIATPAMARQNHVTSRRTAENAYAATSDAACVRTPRVGAFATQPWANPPCEPTSGF